MLSAHWTDDEATGAPGASRGTAERHAADLLIALLLMAFLFGLGAAAQADWARRQAAVHPHSQNVTAPTAQRRAEP